jgi:hypothetical protein
MEEETGIAAIQSGVLEKVGELVTYAAAAAVAVVGIYAIFAAVKFARRFVG